MTDPRPDKPRLTRRRRDTRQRLIAAAYEVFTERGIRDSPVEAICERAGFTRGAFYSNFATKEELFLALFQDENDSRVDRMRATLAEVEQRQVVHDADSLHRLLSEVARVFSEIYAADRTWYLLTSEFHAQALRQPELLPRVSAAQHRFHQGLADLLIALVHRLGLRLTIRPIEAAQVLVALYESALHSVLLDTTTDTASSYVTEVIPQVIGTLMVPAEPGISAAPDSRQ